MSESPRLMIALLLTVCAAGCAGDAAPVGDAVKDWVMPAAERAAVDAVVARAIAAGLPDAKGGRIHIGTLSVFRFEDGAKDPSNKEDFDGAHLHLPDGRWLIGMHYLLQPGPGITVDVEHAPETTLADFTKQAQVHAERNRGISCSFGDVDELAAFPPDQRDLVSTVWRATALTSLLDINDSPVVAAAHLIRLGVPRAELLAVQIALYEQWDVPSPLWSTTAAPLRLLASQYVDEWINARSVSAPIEQPVFRVPSPAIALRHALATHFVQPTSPAVSIFTPVPMPDPLGAALALTDDGDVQARTVIARLRARLAIPPKPPAGADLATRLAAWGRLRTEPYEPFSEDQVASWLKLPPETWDDQFEPAQREAMEEYRRWPTFTAADIGALVALAGDDRPSRWLDEGGVRSVGDNAQRALARIFGCDPRIFVKREVDAPWTADERTATAQALATWWLTSKDRKPEQILLDALGDLPLAETSQLVVRADDARRTTFLDRLATEWQKQRPADPDPQHLAEILRLSIKHPGISTVVGTWPVTGRQRPLLAAWHLVRGNAQPFDVWFAEATAPTITKTVATTTADGQPAVEQESTMGPLVAIASRHLTSERLQRLQVVLAGSPEQEPCRSLLFTVINGSSSAFSEMAVLWGERDHRGFRGGDAPEQSESLKARAALQLALLGSLLGDPRPAPKALIDHCASLVSMSFEGRNSKEKPRPPANDLRLSDVAAVMMRQLAWALQLDELAGKGTNDQLRAEPIDITAERAQRDLTIAKIRQVVATALPPALSAAKLPPILTGITDLPTVGDDKAAF